MTSCTCCSQTLTAGEKKILGRFRELLKSEKEQEGALIPILQKAQNLFGYLPPSVLKEISVGLNKSYSEVAGVVGFYSFFATSPRGKYLIRVCLGTACYVRGGQKVLEAIKADLGVDVGETTDDSMFTLEIGRCFGACGLAPVIMINNDVHQRVKAAKVSLILDSYRRKKGGK